MTVNNNSAPNAAIPVHGMSSSVLEHTLEKPIQIYYKPPEDEINFWMYAMIAAGCAFVVFVIGSIYLMCNNQPTGQPQPLRRHPTTNTRIAEREHL